MEWQAAVWPPLVPRDLTSQPAGSGPGSVLVATLLRFVGGGGTRDSFGVVPWGGPL